MQVTYEQEVWSSEGLCVKKHGSFIPLYINREVLDEELLYYINGHPTRKFTPQVLTDEGKFVEGESVSYGEEKSAEVFKHICTKPYTLEKLELISDKMGKMTTEDRLELLSGTQLGRQILSQYVHPSCITEPIWVKSYYVMPLGLMSPNLLFSGICPKRPTHLKLY